MLVCALWQVTADKNLLRAGRQIWQRIGIHGRDLYAAELHFADRAGPAEQFIEQLSGDISAFDRRKCCARSRAERSDAFSTVAS